MEQRPEDLSGMNIQDAKAYIAAHLASLKLTEKKRTELEADLAKWTSRVELARSKGAEDLAREAEGAAERIRSDLARLQAEEAELRSQIEVMQRQLPTLRARERSVDPDLLEQELLMATGRLPGEEAAAETDRSLAKLEKESKAEAELAALKAKLAGKESGSERQDSGGEQ